MEQWEQKARAVLNICRPEYRWIAMDKNGDWVIYNEKPIINCNEWFIESIYYEFIGYWVNIDPAPEWKNSLIQRSE